MLCTHNGCGKEYDGSDSSPNSCIYHAGAPVFHEGLKSWSCCSDVNKPVLDFDEFMKIPGCTRGLHTSEERKIQPSTSTRNEDTKSSDRDTKAATPRTVTPMIATPPPPPAAPREPIPPPPEEEDDLSISVPVGTLCKRKACGKAFVSDEASRSGDGEEAICVFHPMPPIFREGSKGYLCCKRRVLEFDEFLKIEGCKKGRHLFASKAAVAVAEEFTQCRIDHYQTPTEVHVSVFAKQANEERSSVKIESDFIHLDLYLPALKRFRRSIELFGPVDPTASSFKYFGSKVELILKKQDSRGWVVLEKTDRDLGMNLTFGVGGRTGTVGAKEVILDDTNANKARN